jgi:hypothetical protein
MLSIINDGMLCLMVGAGHKTGLFDAMSRMEPATRAEIAKAAKLNECYVRERLEGTVTGMIVDYDHATDKYRLSEEHATVLTRAAGIDT